MKRQKKHKPKKERDDSMVKPVSRRQAFVMKESMYDKFSKESNKKDIEKIYAMAETFEKITGIKRR